MRRVELEEVVPAQRTNGGQIWPLFFILGARAEELAPFFNPLAHKWG